MRYRREIDGLRAIAVLPVIFYHTGLHVFRGGFVGVDVFFVISGYLITSLIVADLQTGAFSILRFYERRARRILPALFVVLAACLPFAWLWMFPSDLKRFANSLIAVGLYTSNIFYWHESGYFDAAAELKPLLHTWSLAVEEQYYLIFPLTLVIAWKFSRRHIASLIALLAVGSFTIAQYGSAHSPVATFYLLPSRGWELLIGSLLALHIFSKELAKSGTATLSGWSNELLSGVGLILILCAVLTFERELPYPSFYTLVPTLGAALIIGCANQTTIVGRFLSTRVLVGIGLISYSAYLWHYPILAFIRLRSIRGPSEYLLLVGALLSVLLAFLTWKYVERPFRDKRWINRRQLALFSIASTSLVISLGLIGHFKDGFGDRRYLNGTLNELDQRIRFNSGLSDICDQFTLATACRTGESPEILVWGDSNAKQLVDGIIASAPAVRLIQMTKNSCGPLMGVAPMLFSRSWARECLDFNNQVLEWLQKTSTVKYVVLSSLLRDYVSPKVNLLTADGVVASNPKIALRHFLDTLDLIAEKGITPVVFAPMPQNGNDIGRCLAKSALFNADPAECDFTRSDSVPTQATITWLLTQISHRYKVVWPADAICKYGMCNALVGGKFIYRDTLHLSPEGSETLGVEMNWYDRITRR